MRAWRLLALLLVAPLAAPHATPALVVGRAHALTEDASTGPDSDSDSGAVAVPPDEPKGPEDDGVLLVRSWIVEPPPTPPAPDWSEGIWTPLAPPADAAPPPPPAPADPEAPPAEDDAPPRGEEPGGDPAPSEPPVTEDPPDVPEPPVRPAPEPSPGLPCLVCLQVAQLNLAIHKK